MSKSNDEKIELFLTYLERKYIDYQIGETIDNENTIIMNWNNIPDKCQSFVEKCGYTVSWNDQMVQCEICDRWVDIIPGYYGDIPKYKIINGGVMCYNCIIEDIQNYGIYGDVFDCLLDNKTTTMNQSIISVEALNFFGFVNAFMHQGQDDTPESVIKEYMTVNNLDIMPNYIIYINDVGQFDVHFNLMVKKDKSF